MKNTVFLKRHEDKRIRSGHLWAFSNEIREIQGTPEPGDLVSLRDVGGEFLGIGVYNPTSLIAVRLLTRNEEEIDFNFFKSRFEAALELRTALFPGESSFRLINGEADLLPGLVVDKYGPYLSVQTLSFGMDRRLTLICDVLESLFHPKGIIERNDTGLRTLEGLPEKKGILRGTAEPLIITEDGIQYSVNILEGQKTGFFLDQRENRRAIRRFAKDARVLDCFCNDGGFALHAAAAGATYVAGIDSSSPALARAIQNAALNRLAPPVTFKEADVFDYLKHIAGTTERFDLVMLDPPSFARNKKSVTAAKQGYRQLHHAALVVLKKGGILATASCSHHILEGTFLEIINHSALEMGREIQLLEWRGASSDHPVLPGMPETHYLKFGIFRIH